MKKGKILVVGLIGLLMAGGLLLAGCKDESCPKDGYCYVGDLVKETCNKSDCHGKPSGQDKCNCYN